MTVLAGTGVVMFAVVLTIADKAALMTYQLLRMNHFFIFWRQVFFIIFVNVLS